MPRSALSLQKVAAHRDLLGVMDAGARTATLAAPSGMKLHTEFSSAALGWSTRPTGLGALP